MSEAIKHETVLDPGAEQVGKTYSRALINAAASAGVADEVLAQLRTLVDSLRNQWKSAVVVLATVEDGNVSIVSGVTKDLTAKVHAGKLAGAIAQAVGGKGGGRPDMAEAGGKDPAALEGALAQAYTSIESML